MSIEFTKFDDGIAICGDCMDPEVFEFVRKYIGDEKFAMFHWDPPYGNIVSDKCKWDNTKLNQQQFSDLMTTWIKYWYPLLHDGGSIYLWGGTGKPGFRPFYVFTTQIEFNAEMDLIIGDMITWSKRRAIGSNKRFLYCREEALWLIKDKKHNPRVFNIPLTNQLRGYSGFSKKYAAKSPYLRRTNIWAITEKFSGKSHPTEKPLAVIKIPLETSSNKGEWVLDCFGGSLSTAAAARECGRKFVIIEKDETYYKTGVEKLKSFKPGDKY